MDDFFIFVSCSCGADGMECWWLYRLGEAEAKVAELWIGNMMDKRKEVKKGEKKKRG